MTIGIDSFSAEVILAKTIFAILGKVGSDFVKKIIETKIVVSKGVTVYHKSSEIEFAFMLKLGPEHSKANTIINKISSLLNKPIEFDDVIDVNGFGIEHSENLLELKIIKSDKNKTTIDFAHLIKQIKSETVFLKIRKKIPTDLKQLLVVPRLNKTSKHVDKRFIEADIEVALDYADLWSKVLDQYTVRDIEFNFNLEVSPETIVENIPKNLRKRIINAAKTTSTNRDAVSFLNIMMDIFVLFQSDTMIKKLLDTVIVEPSDSFQILSVNPKMQKLEIASVGYPVVLPGSMNITLACRLEGKEIAKTGLLKIDLQKFSKIISELVLMLEQKTNKLKV